MSQPIYEITQCRTPGCENIGVANSMMQGKWCHQHYGIFPHKCEHEGCGKVVEFDDEPWCFTHSPDEGSSVRGYSAWERAQASDHSKQL